MKTVNYYIEDLTNGKCLQLATETESWKQFQAASTYQKPVEGGGTQTVTITCTARPFSDYNSALAHIDNLPNGEYRIFSRIVKS